MYREQRTGSEKEVFSPNCGITLKISKERSSEGREMKERRFNESIRTRVQRANRESVRRMRECVMENEGARRWKG